jgi:peptidoglycan hydrolase CwlO-like protein
MENEDVVKEIKDNTRKIVDKTEILEKALKKRTSFIEKFRRCVSNFWIVSILIILLGINICLHVSHTIIIDGQNLILGFIGIIATFVVVGNYIQVVDVKNEFREKLRAAENLGNEIKMLEEKFEKTANDAKEIESKVKEVYRKITAAEGKLENVEKELERCITF